MSQNSKNKSISQLILLVVVLVLANVIGDYWFFRLDLTSEKRYSLSENTKKLFKSINDELIIDVYLEGNLNVGFKKLARATEELISEINAVGSRHVEYNFIDATDKYAEDANGIQKRLKNLGLSPQAVFEKTEDGRNFQALVYPYAVISYKNKEIPVNLLENIKGVAGSENLNKSIETLEFKFTDAVRKLIPGEKPSIAFLEGHGELDELDVIDITDNLSQYYQVDRGRLASDPSILDPYKAIIIAKPQKSFSESDKFIIDQYLMNGGRIMWLVDAVNVTLDSLRKSRETLGVISNLNIEDQLFKYGVRINPVLIQDIQAGMIPLTVNSGGKRKIVPAPWLYNPLLIPQPDHAISRNMNLVQGEFVSSIDTVNSQLDLKRSVLLRTSRYSKSDQIPVFVSLAFVNEKPVKQSFNESFLPTAVVQEGVFVSVFKNRMVPQGVDLNGSVKTESVPTKIVVVADGDIIKNKVRFKDTNPKILPLGYDEMTKESFGNKDFVLNAINYLCDDDGWMDLRARTYVLRMLDKDKVANESLKWKIINLLLPLLMLGLLGFVFVFYRKMKYTR